MNISPLKAAEGIHLAIKNAERYLIAARTLFRARQYREALLLTFYCFEEEGRVVLIWNSPFHSEKPESWQRWMKRFNSHEEKFWFSKDIDNFAAGKRAFKTNKKLGSLYRKKRLFITYVNFYGGKFQLLENTTKAQVYYHLKLASKRLAYLKQNHPSVGSDEKNISMGITKLKGLTMEQIEKLIKDKE